MEELNLYARIILYLWKSRKFKQEEKKTPHQFVMECLNMLRLDKYSRTEMIPLLAELIKNEGEEITKQDYDSMVKKLKDISNKDIDSIVKNLREVSVKKV